MVFWEGYVSDELMGTFAPIVVYWIYAGFYHLLPPLDNYRLHTKKDKEDKNLVPFKAVVKGVLLQQLVQAIVALVLVSHSTFESIYSRLIIFFHICIQSIEFLVENLLILLYSIYCVACCCFSTVYTPAVNDIFKMKLFLFRWFFSDSCCCFCVHQRFSLFLILPFLY